MNAGLQAAANALETSNGLTGLDKAAILMLALPDEHVTKIFSSLYDDEVALLSKQMASLGTIKSDVVEALYMEFTDQVAGAGTVSGNFSATERLLAQTFDEEKVKEIMEEIRGPAGRTMWEKLSNVSEEVLAGYLKNEYPQTIAVILTKINPAHAAKVLSLFPDELAMDVVQRMLKMESVQRDVINNIETTLKGEFISNISSSSKEDPFQKMAEIFNGFDRQNEERFMGALESNDASLAERIKSLMFTFEDLAKLDTAGIQTVIRVADKTKLSLALKGAPEAIKAMFFSNMSERAGKLMREEMEAMGPVKIKDVDEAQSGIVMQVKELVDKGEIAISEGEEDEELIE